MKKGLFLIVFSALLFAGCNHNASGNSGSTEPDYVVSLSDIQVETAANMGSNFKKLVFTYPTKNVAGETVTASAIMCIPNRIYTASTKPKLAFMVLSNHGATFDKNSVPSKTSGDNIENLASLIGSKDAIGIAADYIGFGASEAQPQAFAYGDVNAKTSLEAVICARMWLQSQGYTWEDKLVNVGFSQGGQTAMHVQKIVDTSTVYGSKVHVTKTFAGGGCYDVNTTVEKSIEKYDPPAFPEVIWLGLATFNTLSNFGYNNTDLFNADVPVSVLITDKNYNPVTNRPSSLNGAWSNSLNNNLLDSNSSLRREIKNKVSSYNCNFTPKSTSKIVMFAASNDDVVPTENSTQLHTYFTNHGYAMTTVDNLTNADFSADKVFVQYEENATSNKHGAAGTQFFNKVIDELASSRW